MADGRGQRENIICEHRVTKKSFAPNEDLGADFEKAPDGFVDYVLLNTDGRPVAVVEAKKESIEPLTAKEQARAYANGMGVAHIAGVHALQQSAARSKNRFLFEMATGTRKTLLSAAIAKLYLRTNNATRVLFLVDRLELENQALRHFTAYLANDGIQTVIYKQKRQDWRAAQVVVTTIQSLAARNRFLSEFAPTDFQLIISDEAHRTISGNNRTIFEYFIGAKLGLTATPRDYLKGLDEEDRQNDPRADERRLLLDTTAPLVVTMALPLFGIV